MSEDAHIQSWKTEKELNFGGTLYLTAMNTKKGEMGENGSTSTSDTTDGKIIFLKFDLSQMKEQKDAFDKAQLCLTYVTLRKDTDKNKDDNLKVAVLEDVSWTEGNGDSKGNSDGGITWNTKPSFTVDASTVKTSESYNLGAAFQDKPGSGYAVNGARVKVDITDIVKEALDANKESLSLVVNEANGYEHYFVSKEGAGESGYTSAAPDMAPSIQLNIPTAIDLEGPCEMTLTEGYAAAETQSFALKGGSGPYHVTLSGNTGDGKITWDADTNQIKIAEGLTKGVYEVTVTSVSSQDASVEKSVTFTLTVEEMPVPTVTSVSVNPVQVSVEQGKEQSFTAEVTGENNPSTEVIWGVSGGVSSATVITTEGKLTVGSDETAKMLTVTAVSKADQEKSGTAIVTVLEKTVEPIKPIKYIVSLDANGGEVNPQTLEVEKGEKIGTLPTPTKTDCTFEGWYTAKENGEAVTEETIVNENMTIYAHWKTNQQTQDPKPPTEQQVTELSKKVAAAEELLEKLSDEEKEKLQPVINEVKELLKKENVTAKEIEAALEKLSAAVKVAENTIDSNDEKPRLNEVFNGSNGLKYKITAYKGTVKNIAVIGAAKQFTTLTVPATVKYKGQSFKVTAIGDQALANQKKLKSSVIGKYVTTIGKKAFYNDNTSLQLF